MNGTASVTEWLACGGVGCGASWVALGLIKLGLDHPVAPLKPGPRLPPALPARAPQILRWHAAPLDPAETQPIRVLPDTARHAKKAA